eukprot:TRINITY_DN21330_c0_g3_i1.p1 TRINITY_DN21330_c0_g3~~TRINITY_DN21330_c0_g3_i1.p1  ORF type:complete len:446 (+),score=97.34 TRINITY_DN21330_c0_g3_i1:74-1339(+)
MAEADIRVQPLGGGAPFTVRCAVAAEGSVAALRRAVADQTGCPAELQRLVYSSRPLPHDFSAALGASGLRPGATVYLIKEKAARCQVVIKSHTGDIIPVDVAAPGTDTVAAVLMARVAAAWGIPAEEQRLTTQGGVELSGGQTISAAGLARGGAVSLAAPQEEPSRLPAAAPAAEQAPGPDADGSSNTSGREAAAALMGDLLQLLGDVAMADYAPHFARAGVRSVSALASCGDAEAPPEVPAVAWRVLREQAAAAVCAPAAQPAASAPPLARSRSPMHPDLAAVLDEEDMADYAEALSRHGVRCVAALRAALPHELPDEVPPPARKLLLRRGAGGNASEWGSLEAALEDEGLRDYSAVLRRCGVRSLSGVLCADPQDLPAEMPGPAQRALLARAKEPSAPPADWERAAPQCQCSAPLLDQE